MLLKADSNLIETRQELQQIAHIELNLLYNCYNAWSKKWLTIFKDGPGNERQFRVMLSFAGVQSPRLPAGNTVDETEGSNEQELSHTIWKQHVSNAAIWTDRTVY